MKRIILLIASVTFLTNVEAQYSAKQNVVDFNAIEINSAAHVYLVQSDSNYVTLSAKDSVRRMPRMEVKGGVLEINSAFRGTMEVHVKNITSIRVGEAAMVTCIDTLKADNLTIRVSDAGSADIWVHAKTIKARGNDASSITLRGSADSLDVKASDASHVNAAGLSAVSVHASASDGSVIGVHAINSIDANATDGSSINVRGKPAQKNTSASDGGSVNMYNSAWVKMREGKVLNLVEKDTSVTGKTVQVITGDGFIGGGFVMGGSNGVNIKYGASREFIMGFGGTHVLFKRDLIGLDVYYKSTDFLLAQNSGKSDSLAQHQSEKVSLQNFGGLVFDRLWIGKTFIDAGIYGDWAFHSKLITWDNDVPDVGSTKTIERNLGYINAGNYGLTFRFACADGLLFYFNYRLSGIFQNSTFPGYGNVQLPNCVLGLTFGF